MRWLVEMQSPDLAHRWWWFRALHCLVWIALKYIGFTRRILATAALSQHFGFAEAKSVAIVLILWEKILLKDSEKVGKINSIKI